ncbi:MAG: glycosyltransferase family 2 protein [Rhodobacter sp.]|nr:glycosyltransferase family 2 protein [Rhodobacter sp.]
MSLPTVASLWIGGSLSFLEQVCLKSFVDHGHRTILYTYGEVGGVPDGVEVFDANLIFPNENYIRHAKSGSPAVHADAFRYRMIELQNVIWVDADVLCMRPWDFTDQWVFGWEKPDRLVCNAVLGLPRFSKTLRRLNELCATEYPVPPWAKPEEKARLEAAAAAGEPVHVSELEWGVWGPAALTYFLNETGEMEHVLPQMAFFPIPFKDRRDLLKPGGIIDDRLDLGCYGVHLWNRRLRRRIVTHENGIPHSESFVGRALERHGIDPHDAMIPDEPPAHVLAEAEEDIAADFDPGVRAPAEPEPVVPEVLVSQNPNVTVTPPAALAGMPVMGLQQSPEYQRMIDDLEGRTGNITGWLKPPEEPVGNDRILIVTSMKNEAPFILEWIAYHLGIGATHFLVYTNDCSDNTNAILDRLQELGHVTRAINPWDPASGKKPQHEALKDAVKQPCYAEADWVLTIDVDEFVNIHVGEGTFVDLFEASNYPNVISFTWKFFGNKGIETYEDRPVSEQFVACAPEFIPKPRLGWGFKSMFHKSSPYRKIGVHRPLGIEDGEEDQVRWVNGSGRAMPDMLLTNNGWRSTKRSLGYRLATLNHYILRSAESFLVKRERGRINHTDHDQGIDYWSRRNYATETDDRILVRHALMKPILSDLMADKALKKMHSEAVAWHRGRIAHLMEQPDYRNLYEDLVTPGRPDALQIAKEAEALEAAKEEVEDGESGGRRPDLTLAPAAPLTTLKMISAPATAATRPVHERFLDATVHARGSKGFLWEGPSNAIMFVPRSKRLVVSFDNVSSAREEGQRWPWGFKVMSQDMGCSVLGVMGAQRNWFRDDFVHDGFDALRDQGFFDQFDDVLFYGASMGGFGALVYQQCCPGANVLAIAPQSTLNREIVPNEDRWGWTTKLDWTGRYSDAAGTTDGAGKVFVVADPYYPPDYDQVSRLTGDNITWLRTPFMGHQLPNAFVVMGILKDLLYSAVDGRLTPALFYPLFRARRDLPRYQHDLLMQAERRGRTKLAIRVCEYTLKKRHAGNIKRSLDRLRAQLAAETGAKEAAE